MTMKIFTECEEKPTRYDPVIEIGKPGYVLAPKRGKNPESNLTETYLEGTSLTIKLSTKPTGFSGKALLIGKNLGCLQLSKSDLESGLVKGYKGEHGVGLEIAAGALKNGLTITVSGVKPSSAYEDIELTLALEKISNAEVGPPAKAKMTSVELTLDIDDKPRRDNTSSPKLMSPGEKVFEGSVLIAELASSPLPRTKLTLRRAIPHDFPGKIEVQILDESDNRSKVTLATKERSSKDEQFDHALSIDNSKISTKDGAVFYAKGLLASKEKDDSITILAKIKGDGEQGDYVNVFVDPLVVARWGYSWIYPEFDGGLASGSTQEGDDRDNHLSEVELVVDTAGLPLDAVPTITVHRSPDEKEVKPPGLDKLKLDKNGSVVTQSGARPVFTTVGRRGSWVPFDKPFFFFKVAFDELDAKAETPRDQEKALLRAKYLHTFLVDDKATDIETVPCRGQILSYVYGAALDNEKGAEKALEHHRFLKPNLSALPSEFSSWLDVAKNTYSYFHFSHGGYGGKEGEKSFYCFIAFGKGQLNFVDVSKYYESDKLAKHDLPRHLMFLASCHSAWDPRLAMWLIGGRADCYVIGFRTTVTRSEVQAVASKFFYDWLTLHGGDPSRVAASFQLAAKGYDDVQPRLFDKSSDFSVKPLY